MSETPEPKAPARVCRFLRTKTMFYGFEREHALEVGPECGTATFWCGKTAVVLGPDGATAHREECTAARSCFEE